MKNIVIDTGLLTSVRQMEITSLPFYFFNKFIELIINTAM